MTRFLALYAENMNWSEPKILQVLLLEIFWASFYFIGTTFSLTPESKIEFWSHFKGSHLVLGQSLNTYTHTYTYPVYRLLSLKQGLDVLVALFTALLQVTLSNALSLFKLHEFKSSIMTSSQDLRGGPLLSHQGCGTD